MITPQERSRLQGGGEDNSGKAKFEIELIDIGGLQYLYWTPSSTEAVSATVFFNELKNYTEDTAYVEVSGGDLVVATIYDIGSYYITVYSLILGTIINGDHEVLHVYYVQYDVRSGSILTQAVYDYAGKNQN